MTRLPVNPVMFPAKPPAFAPPRESLPLNFVRPAQEVRNTPPQVAQSEEIRSRGEVTVDAARELLIVKVNPDGSDGPAHQLPPTALADLRLLFERWYKRACRTDGIGSTCGKPVSRCGC